MTRQQQHRRRGQRLSAAELTARATLLLGVAAVIQAVAQLIDAIN
jgi:hypothetical protein